VGIVGGLGIVGVHWRFGGLGVERALGFKRALGIGYGLCVERALGQHDGFGLERALGFKRALGVVRHTERRSGYRQQLTPSDAC
jgi:hypothetical protein